MQNDESELPCIYLLGVLILPLSTIFLLDFGTVLTVWYFFSRFWNCFDSVVFFAFHIITRNVDLYNKTNTEQIE